MGVSPKQSVAKGEYIIFSGNSDADWGDVRTEVTNEPNLVLGEVEWNGVHVSGTRAAVTEFVDGVLRRKGGSFYFVDAPKIGIEP